MTPDTARSRALVVEEEQPIRELVRLHLNLAGFQIDEAADGRTALAKARAMKVDLIILDVMLPALDGVTVCRAIRSEGPNT